MSTRWKIDIDYYRGLDDEAFEWLREFNNHWVDGKVGPDGLARHREVYAAKNDIMNVSSLKVRLHRQNHPPNYVMEDYNAESVETDPDVMIDLVSWVEQQNRRTHRRIVKRLKELSILLKGGKNA